MILQFYYIFRWLLYNELIVYICSAISKKRILIEWAFQTIYGSKSRLKCHNSFLADYLFKFFKISYSKNQFLNNGKKLNFRSTCHLLFLAFTVIHHFWLGLTWSIILCEIHFWAKEPTSPNVVQTTVQLSQNILLSKIWLLFYQTFIKNS